MNGPKEGIHQGRYHVIEVAMERLLPHEHSQFFRTSRTADTTRICKTITVTAFRRRFLFSSTRILSNGKPNDNGSDGG